MKDNSRNKIIVLGLALTIIILSSLLINVVVIDKTDVNYNNKNEYTSNNKIVKEEKNTVVDDAGKNAIENRQENIIDEKMDNIQENISFESTNNQEKTNNSNEFVQEVNDNVDLKTENVKDNVDIKTEAYFNKALDEVSTYVNNDDENNLRVKAKAKFVELVDFIFYGTKINGVTFNQLSENTKDKLVSIVNKIDNKIESKVPGYKDTIKTDIKDTYIFLASKLKQGITIVDDKLEKNIGEEKYNNIKDDANNISGKAKEIAGNVIDKTKDVTGTVKDKISNWYKEWK